MQLPAVFPERFAVEWGQDEYGPFMAFAVKGIVQRMRWILQGSFLMGSPVGETGRADEENQHLVKLTRGYWLADTPVTQALWEATTGTNPSHFKGANNPVESVSWDDCQEFIQRLNERVEGLHARLPTEAEWEYACRGGKKDTATWVGDLESGQEIKAPQLDPIAWYGANANGRTHPVAQKLANPWGLYDMLGNVYEWCADRLGSYDVTALQDPHGPEIGAARVMRGGSWFSDAMYVRAAHRGAYPSGRHLGTLGFRLARGPAPSQGSGGASRRTPSRTIAP